MYVYIYIYIYVERERENLLLAMPFSTLSTWDREHWAMKKAGFRKSSIGMPSMKES